MDLVLATRSTHKIKEIRTILDVVPNLRVLDLTEASVPYDDAEEDLEPFDTFEENAASKAAYFQRITGLPTVADRSMTRTWAGSNTSESSQTTPRSRSLKL